MASIRRQSYVLSLLMLIFSIISSNSIVLDDKCSYSDDFLISNYYFEPKQELEIQNIKNIGQLSIILKTNQKMHFKLLNSEGSAIFSSLDRAEKDVLESFQHKEMKITNCIGNCKENKFISVAATEDAREWIHIDSITEPLTISVVNDDVNSGAAVVEYLWGCHSSCEHCLHVNSINKGLRETTLIKVNDISNTVVNTFPYKSKTEEVAVEDDQGEDEDDTMAEVNDTVTVVNDTMTKVNDTVVVVDLNQTVTVASNCRGSRMVPGSTLCPTPVPTSLPTHPPSLFPTQLPTQPSQTPTPVPTSPTLVPTSVPTSPSETPTILPTQPTQVPIPCPSNDPTLTPTHLPTEYPTPYPTHAPTSPTSVPTHAPTSPTQSPTHAPVFTSRPTLSPSHSPTAPSFEPTHSPTLTPSFQPTNVPSYHPSSQPTQSPSSLDTGSLAIGLSLSASVAPTTQDKSSLKTVIASQIGVSEGTIRNFEVVFTEATRRNLLAGTWDVTFRVVVSLSETNSDSIDDFKNSFETSMRDSSFETNVLSSITSVDAVNSITAIIVTRQPTSVPTSRPTDKEKEKSSKFSIEIGSANFIILIVVGVVALITVALGCSHDYLTKYSGVHPMKRFSDTISSMTDCDYQDSATFGGGNSFDDDDDIFKGLELGNLDRFDSMRFLANLKARGYVLEDETTREPSTEPPPLPCNGDVAPIIKCVPPRAVDITSPGGANRAARRAMVQGSFDTSSSSESGAVPQFNAAPGVPSRTVRDIAQRLSSSSSSDSVASPSSPPPPIVSTSRAARTMVQRLSSSSSVSGASPQDAPTPFTSRANRAMLQRLSSSSSMSGASPHSSVPISANRANRRFMLQQSSSSSSSMSGASPHFSRFPMNNGITTSASMSRFISTVDEGVVLDAGQDIEQGPGHDSRLHSLDTLEDVLQFIGRGTSIDNDNALEMYSIEDSNDESGLSSSQSGVYSTDNSIAMRIRKKKRKPRPRPKRNSRGFGTSLDDVLATDVPPAPVVDV